ncbi:hypothetical protein BG006_004347 [Podila minutissima]|uniref:FAD-binding domain-containing protein n=1 Tax=Podila minutissima TaxID=64525 RepID=A0A9P5SX75_9FUNG|nr:hypothetical protein BG006_004347 [Podila minutissima]
MPSPEADIQTMFKPHVPSPIAHSFPSTAISSGHEWSDTDKPKILIVGAGIGGLLLGNLLRKAGCQFLIIEKAKELKPLGSCMAAGSGVSNLFRQLGILDEFKAIGKPHMGLEVYSNDRQRFFLLDSSEHPQYCGATEQIVARPDLHDLLLRQVPRENIHMSKKVIAFEQNDEGVTIHCSDDSIYRGDILVGADGAHSAVREHLFQVLLDKGMLPSVDDGDLPFDCVCLVGQTEVLDPEDFPEMKLPNSKFNSILADDYVWVTATTLRNTICWMAVQHLDAGTSKRVDPSSSSSWGPEAAEAMCNEVRHLQIPSGKHNNLTLGDLIDRTPKHTISKVMLEEKIFSIWHAGRTVLLGDGAGALTAMHDAVALANWISTLQKPKLADVEAVFAEYQTERLPAVQEAAATTRLFKRMGGQV